MHRVVLRFPSTDEPNHQIARSGTVRVFPGTLALSPLSPLLEAINRVSSVDPARIAPIRININANGQSRRHSQGSVRNAATGIAQRATICTREYAQTCARALATTYARTRRHTHSRAGMHERTHAYTNASTEAGAYVRVKAHARSLARPRPHGRARLHARPHWAEGGGRIDGRRHGSEGRFEAHAQSRDRGYARLQRVNSVDSMPSAISH
jgi:hypothetical protein